MPGHVGNPYCLFSKEKVLFFSSIYNYKNMELLSFPMNQFSYSTGIQNIFYEKTNVHNLGAKYNLDHSNQGRGKAL